MSLATRRLRALDVLDVVPAHHLAILIRDQASTPHLMPGEFAVIDTHDREPCHGELFAISYSSGPCVVQIVVRADATGNDYIMCAPLNRPRNLQAFQDALRAGLPLVASDGPYDRTHLRSKLLGRVVGVMEPT